MPSIKSKFYLQISILLIVFFSLVGLILAFSIFPTISKIHNQSYNYAVSSRQIKDLISRQYQIEKTLHQIKQIQNEKILGETSIESEVLLIILFFDFKFNSKENLRMF